MINKELRVLEIKPNYKIYFRLSRTKSGKVFLDIRKWVKTRRFEGFTKKGIAIPIELLDEFEVNLHEAIKEIKSVEI